MATGKPITGRYCIHHAPVVLYNAEDPLEELQMRLAATAQFLIQAPWSLTGENTRQSI